jgi:hypothetical protein
MIRQTHQRKEKRREISTDASHYQLPHHHYSSFISTIQAELLPQLQSTAATSIDASNTTAHDAVTEILQQQTNQQLFQELETIAQELKMERSHRWNRLFHERNSLSETLNNSKHDDGSSCILMALPVVNPATESNLQQMTFIPRKQHDTAERLEGSGMVKDQGSFAHRCCCTSSTRNSRSVGVVSASPSSHALFSGLYSSYSPTPCPCVAFPSAYITTVLDEMGTLMNAQCQTIVKKERGGSVFHHRNHQHHHVSSSSSSSSHLLKWLNPVFRTKFAEPYVNSDFGRLLKRK